MQKTLRMIKLTSLQDEYAYLMTEDYTDLIARITAQQEVQLSLPMPLNLRVLYMHPLLSTSHQHEFSARLYACLDPQHAQLGWRRMHDLVHLL